MEVCAMRSLPAAVVMLWLAGGLCHCPGSAWAAGNGGDAAARQQWMLGYLKVEQADTALRAEQFALARQLYTEALGVFTEVGHRFPDWNPELVRYRTAHCREQLRTLDEAAASALERMGRTDLVAEVRRLRAVRQDTDAQAEALTARTEQLTKALGIALTERQQSAAEVTRLSAELDQARAREADLTARLEALGRDLAARETDLERLRAAAGDVTSLKHSLAELGRRAESAEQARREAEAARTQVAEMQAVQRQTAAREADLKADVDRLRREGEALRADRDREARARRDASEQTTQAGRATQTATEEIQALRRQLSEARRDRDGAAARLAESEARAATSEADLAATVRDRDALKAEVADQGDRLRALQAEDVARLREGLAAAARQLDDMQAVAARDQAALTAARETVQRLTAEQENEQRARRQAAEAEHRQQAEVVRAETAAAKDLAAGDMTAAEGSLRRLLELRPQDAAAAARLGILLADRGELEAALPLLETARRGLPDDTDVLLRLGASQLRRGQALPAVAALLQATVVAPQRADVRHLAAVALVEAGWRDAGEQQFMRAFELDDRRSDTAYCLAALLAAGTPPRRQEARLWYERALRLGAARDAGLDRFLSQDK
jgi:chromosome segregation ATPase